MARLAAVEASPVLDVDFGLLALVSRVAFFEAVRTRSVGLAPSWPFPFGSRSAFVSVRLFAEELASNEGTHLFVVCGAALHESCQLSAEGGVSVV